MKGVILCAGQGTRLRPLTHTVPKVMLPVANRPVLAYAVAALREAGVDEIALVLSPVHRWLQEEIGDGAAMGVRLQYLFQPEPRGIADATLLARDFVSDEPFILYLGDNLTGSGLRGAVELFQTAAADALLLVKEVAHPQQFGVAVVEGGRVIRVVEKPSTPPSRLAIAGIYVFSPAIFRLIADLKPSPRGELEITDAIARLIEAGCLVLVHPVVSWWCDTGTAEGMLAANHEVLDRLSSSDTTGALLNHSIIQGRVIAAPGAVIEDSLIRGPAVIGQGAILHSAFVGPYTSVGPGCRIEQASVEHSILLEQASIRRLPYRLTSSILGRKSIASVDTALSHELQLVVGDDGRVLFPGGLR